MVAELEGSEAENFIEHLVFVAALVDEVEGAPILIEHEGGHEQAAVAAKGGTDKGLLDWKCAVAAHHGFCDHAGAEGEGGDFLTLQGIESALSVFDEEQ